MPEPGERAFVWTAWALMTLGAFAFVAHFRTDVPVWDDYQVVPALLGARPVSPGYLWEQVNEHRIPVPKLILIGLGRLAGGDIRVGMFLSVGAMSGLAAALIALAGRLPGGVKASDAFFPILLLHPGHATNFLWSFQITPLLPTALASALLVPIASRSAWPGPATAWGVGVVLAILPLSGGNGIVFVPPLAAWLLVASRSGGSRVGLAAVPGLVLSALYFVGYRPSTGPESPDGIVGQARTAVQFLAVGVGVPAGWAWPWSGAAVLALIAAAVGCCVVAWATRPEERPRLVGLGAFLAGTLALAVGVGSGRGWAGDRAGFADRYVAMATPICCWLAIALRLYAPVAWGRFVANALFLLVAVLIWPNAEVGFRTAREGLDKARALANDIRDGMPPYRIARVHVPYLHPRQDEVRRFLPILKRAKVGPFGALVDDTPLAAIPVDLTPVSLDSVTWDRGTAHGIGVAPKVTFALESARYVAGIQIVYAHSNRRGSPCRFKLGWKRPGQPGYTEERTYSDWYLPTGSGETTIWVDAIIDRFRVEIDNQPCDFRFERIDLLVPER